MTDNTADVFETTLTRVEDPAPRIVGPWRKPAQMLAEQDIGGRPSIHDAKTAQQFGFTGGAIEGPTHFSQLEPLGHELFSDAWHERGCISAHYRNAVVEGEDVQAWAEPLADRARIAKAGVEKQDETPVLSATLSIGPDHPETELESLMAGLRPAGQLIILRDMEVGMKGVEEERVSMGFDRYMGKLYPFTLRQKLDAITEPCLYYTPDGATNSPWGRPIVPFEMISVLAWHSSPMARFPVRQPSSGLFVNQEIRLLDGPVLVDEEYVLEREIVALSESRRVESWWSRTDIIEAKSDRKVATMLLNSAVFKASFPDYETELAAQE